MPVSCSVYDQFEIAIMHRKSVKLVLTNSNTFVCRLVDLKTENGLEFAITEGLEKINLEEIVSFEVVD